MSPTASITTLDIDGRAADADGAALDVEIVVPVHNEQAVLERSIRRLCAYLETELPYRWQVSIVDNASTDDTPLVAERLQGELRAVR